MNNRDLIIETYQGPTYSPYGLICEQHVDEVIGYWSKWQRAINQPIYTRDALNILETKLQENIAGMMSNTSDSWSYITGILKDNSPASVFAAAQIAFLSYKTSRIRTLIEYVSETPELESGLVSALVWMPEDITHPWLRKLLKSKNLNHKALALRACRLRGEMPHKYLNLFFKQTHCLKHKELYIECLRIAGELKLYSQKKCLLLSLNRQEPFRFWGLYSLALMGEKDISRQLAPYLFDENEYQEKAINIAFRVLPIEECWALIEEFKEHSQFRRQTLRALSCLGDPAALPWVLEQMKDPRLARASGETFFNITGININTGDFSIEAPYTKEELYELDPEQTAECLEYDDYLPWPNAEKLWEYWHSTNRPKFTPKKRHFLGQEITPDILKQALKHSKQPQRRSATLELALQLNDYCLYRTQNIYPIDH